MVNKVILVGNLGRDPELRFTPSGRALAKFPVATSEVWKDQNNQRQERTDWHNIVVWGPQAENCGKYLSKGRQVFIEGSIRTRSYEDKEGQKKWMTEIVARDVRFLGGGGGPGGGGAGGGRGPSEDFSAPPGDDDGGSMPEDDIPF